MSIDKLLTLQKLDVEILEIRRSAKVFPEQLKTSRAETEKAQKTYDTAKKQLDALEREHKDGTVTLEQEAERLKKSRTKLKQLKTPYEFQAMNREIQNTEKSNETLQEKLLLLSQQMEDLKKNLATYEEVLKKADEAMKVVENEVNQKNAEFEGVIGGKLEHQKKLQTEIERPLLSKYLFIQKKYPDVIVQVIAASCQGCFRNIPPQMFNEMLKSRRIEFCPNCQRMIYVADTPSGNA